VAHATGIFNQSFKSESWDQASDQFRLGIEMDPNVSILHENLATALEQAGEQQQAVEEGLIMRASRGEAAEHLAELRAAYQRSGLCGFHQCQLAFDLDRWKGCASDSFHIAAQYAHMGNFEQAILWLEKLFDARSGLILWIKLYPQFRSLHHHHRFQEIVREVGLPQ
jgi:tetratricopeptide (TPR) repeat protein